MYKNQFSVHRNGFKQRKNDFIANMILVFVVVLISIAFIKSSFGEEFLIFNFVLGLIFAILSVYTFYRSYRNYKYNE